MIKILHMRPRLELGGVSAHMALLSEGLVQRGHHAAVATSGGEALATIKALGLTIGICPSLYPSDVLNLLLSVLRINLLARTGGFDIMHSHHRFTTTVGYLVSRITGIPLIATIHEFKLNHRGLSRFWTGQAAIVPSRALRDHLIAHYNLPTERVHVIHNAVKFPPVDKHSPLRDGSLRIGYVGRLSPEKGPRYFLESVPLIRQFVPEACFFVIGSGPDEQALRSQAALVGLAPDQVFLGHRTDIPTQLCALDIVVIPSLAESFSLVALEAMHQGRPVVASNVGGIPEVVQDGETGMLVAPRDAPALARAVCRLAADPALRQSMGARAVAVAQSAFSPDRMVEETIMVYERVMRDSSGRSKQRKCNDNG